ncbi:glycosyltransferase [Patescibacteria group bacterium]|nr:glycosyltransferase [Patescibacteria group bacterium]
MLLHIIEPFDKLALNICDYAWYASQSNFDKRVEIGQVKNPDDPKHKVVHWGTGGSLIGPVSSNYLDTGILRLVYFGSINPEKGLDILFESLPRLIKLVNGKLEILIIGGDTEYKKELQKEIKKQGNDKYVKFYGFMSTDEFDKIAETCDLGLALFVPEIGGQPNFSYYADPSKPRDYLANGLPVLITAVPFIHKDIQEYNAGIVLDKYSAESLVLAVSAYVKNPSMYKKGAYKLAQVDRYDVYYGSKFGLVYKDLQN